MYMTAAGVAEHIFMPGNLLAWWGKKSEGEPLPEGTKPGVKEPAPLFCNGRLRLKSGIHGAAYEFQYRDTAGNYDPKTLAALNWFLRCRDGNWQYMDIRALESLNYLSALLGVPEILVNSGYRSPQYNKSLAIKSENVARNSLHQYGRALDFCIPAIPIKEVCSYALYARNAIGYGGIGYYPKAGFVHMDSGATMQWAKG